MEWLANEKRVFPYITPATNCLCPPAFPQTVVTTSSNISLKCTDPGNIAGGYVARLANQDATNSKFYLPAFLVDGNMKPFFEDLPDYPVFWASQPGNTEMTVTIEIKDLVDVS